MPESTRNRSTVTVATMATANMQSVRYTDSRVEVLSARLDAIQVTLHRERAREVKSNARCKFIGDGACAVTAVGLAILLDHLILLPHLAVILISGVPTLAQPLFEFIRKL